MEQRYGIGIVHPDAEPEEIVYATVKYDIQLVGSQPFDADADYAIMLQSQQELDTRLSFLFVFPGKVSMLINNPIQVYIALDECKSKWEK